MAIKKREEFITILNKLKCALTANEVLEQSNAFIFQGKSIYSFNGELFAITHYDIGIGKDFAIVGIDFLRLLEKFPDEHIKMSLEGNELIIKGKNKRAGITIFEKILLPIDEIEIPKKMKKAPDGFFESIIQCARICGKDHMKPRTTHVNLSSNKIQATDSFRVFRVDMETGYKKDIMIPADALLSIGNKHIIKTTTKDQWFHVMTKDKTIYSIRCSKFNYFKDKVIDDILIVKGSIGKFPKTMTDTLERARVMQNNDYSEARITLKKGMVKIRTEKDGGWYEEKRKVKYSGKSISFTVSIDFLKDILSKTNKVKFGESKIKIKKNNFQFVIVTEQE